MGTFRCISAGNHELSDRLHVIYRVSNLDSQAMLTEWDRIRTKQGAHWKVTKNCADIVLRVLNKGLARRIDHPAICTPKKIARFCNRNGDWIAKYKLPHCPAKWGSKWAVLRGLR